jgi:biopolymer transport protein ExbD
MARFGGLGRMRRARHLNAEVNIINLVDVILVLLIIFMITAPIMSGGVQVQLPKSAVGPVDESDALNIAITSNGQISIGESTKTMSYEQFRATVGVTIANKHPKSAVIRSDARSDVGTLLLVMGVLKQHKLDLQLSAEPMEKP